jgi:anti-sigma B factor antagonist
MADRDSSAARLAADERRQRPRPRPPLALRLERDHVRTVLALGGELDMAGASHLDQAMTAVRADRPEEVLVDLRDLSFLDSSGIMALLRVRAVCEGIGSRLAVRRGPDHVQRRLANAGVIDRFRFAN